MSDPLEPRNSATSSAFCGEVDCCDESLTDDDVTIDVSLEFFHDATNLAAVGKHHHRVFRLLARQELAPHRAHTAPIDTAHAAAQGDQVRVRVTVGLGL